MAAPTRLGRVLDSFVLMSRDQRLMRLAAGLSPLAVLGCASGAGAAVGPWAVVVVAALAVGCAAYPDSHFALVTLAFLGWYWVTRVPDPGSVWSLPSALAALVLHAASAMTSTAPVATVFDPLTRRRWLGRVGVVAAGTAAAWLVALGVRAARAPGLEALAVAALVVLAAAGWALRERGRTE